MPTRIGQVEAIFRYPVKSMRGESLADAVLGWHGVEGDRRLAFRRLDVRGGFPWLCAGKFPALINFTPVRHEEEGREALPTHVRTPEGDELPVFGEELAADIGRRGGGAVQMMHLKHGMFDDAPISVITAGTVREICSLAEKADDVRRFRPNILVRTTTDVPFDEDAWVGGELRFGEAEDAPTVRVTMRDLRCVMVNLDPDGGKPSPEVMKAALRANENNAGVYGTVTGVGRLAVGQPIFLHRQRG